MDPFEGIATVFLALQGSGLACGLEWTRLRGLRLLTSLNISTLLLGGLEWTRLRGLRQSRASSSMASICGLEWTRLRGLRLVDDSLADFLGRVDLNGPV